MNKIVVWSIRRTFYLALANYGSETNELIRLWHYLQRVKMTRFQWCSWATRSMTSIWIAVTRTVPHGKPTSVHSYACQWNERVWDEKRWVTIPRTLIMSFISPIGQKENKREREKERKKKSKTTNRTEQKFWRNTTRVLSRKIIPAFKVQSTLPWRTPL